MQKFSFLTTFLLINICCILQKQVWIMSNVKSHKFNFKKTYHWCICIYDG